MSHEENNSVLVAAIINGTVIDHIPPDWLLKVAGILGLEQFGETFILGNYLTSKKMGRKGILKIEDFFDAERLKRIALIVPEAKINIIREGKVVEKYNPTLPDELVNLVLCNNPKCITNAEAEHLPTRFHLVNKDSGSIRCHYCERIIEKEDIRVL